MTKLRSYFLWFCFMHRANLNCRCDCSTITSECRRYFNSRSIFRRNDFCLIQIFKERTPCTDSTRKKKFTLGFTLIFWGYNLCGVLFGLFLFSRKDPEILQNFMLYLKQPQFLSIMVIMLLMLAIPLYLITYWFYGKQAQRMANKMFNVS